VRLEIPIREIRSGKLVPRAQELLSLMTFLDRQGILQSLLRRQDENHVELVEALGILKAFSLVTRSEAGNTFDMHRFPQLVVRKWLIVQREVEKWAGKALAALSHLYSNGKYEI